MPNPIKYSTGAVTRALKKGNFYLGTNDVKKTPTSSTGFWNGYNVPTSGYVVYLNKASNGPSIYVAANDSEFITLTRRISGTTYSTAADCLVWFSTQSDKMTVDKYYSPLITDSLVLDLDAGFAPSYPRINSTWYDLGPNVRNASLTNGPVFNSDGYFSMDGVDDNIRVSGNIASSSTATVAIWMRTTDTQWLWCRGNGDNSFYLGAVKPDSGWYSGNVGIVLSYYVDTNDSFNPATEGYLDGRYHMFEAKDVNWSSWTLHEFFFYPGFEMQGDVARIVVYNKTLTPDESIINYYQGNIVTSNLVLAVDAGNILSYPASGTDLYDLTTNYNHGTLLNGVSYGNGAGGYLITDGSDDKIEFNDSSSLNPTSTITIEAMIYPSVFNGDVSVVSKWTTGAGTDNSYVMFLGQDVSNYGFGFAVQQTNGTIPVLYTNATYTPGNWYHLVAVGNGSTLRFYVNGVLDPVSVSYNGTIKTTNKKLEIGSLREEDNIYTFNGRIGFVRIYSQALNSDQVARNFKAIRKRYGI